MDTALTEEVDDGGRLLKVILALHTKPLTKFKQFLNHTKLEILNQI